MQMPIRLFHILMTACLILAVLAGCSAGVQETSAAATTKAAEASSEAPASAGTTEAAAEAATRPAQTARSESMEQLEASLTQYLSTQRGTWSIYVRRLDTGEDFCIHDEVMTAASLIKLAVAGCYLDKVDRGERSDDLADSLKAMLSWSDNAAANRLIDALGMDEINAFCQARGLTSTQLNRKMLQTSDQENLTSARDCGRVLADLSRGTFISEEASGRMLAALLAQERRHKIPAGLPEEAVCANKTGELASVENDAALVFGTNRDYVLVVMSMDLPAVGTAQSAIKEISRMTWASLEAEEAAPEDAGREATEPALKKPGKEREEGAGTASVR